VGFTERTPVPVERIDAALERVLARPEFQVEESWLGRFIDWLSDVFPDIGERELGTVVEVTQVLLVLVLGVMLAWLVIQAWRQGFFRRRGLEAVVLELDVPGAERAATLRRAAADARRSGNLALALRLNFFALVVGLGTRGDLEYRDAWTNRELLERGEPRAGVRELLAPLVAELDAKGFGHLPTSPRDVDRLELLCDAWLGAPA